MAVFNPDVRFTPESGHVRCTSRCPLSANSGHSILSACGSGEGVPSNPKCGKSILFKFDTGRVLPRQRPLVFLGTPSGDNAAKLALALSSMGYVRTHTASAWSEAEFQKIVSQIRPERRRIGRTLAAECQERHDGCMGSGRTRSTTPDLFSTSARVPLSPSENSAPSSLATDDGGAAALSQSYALPKNLPSAIGYLDDDQLDRLLAAVLVEQRRRGKKVPVSDKSPRKTLAKVVAPPLPQGKLNAIRAAFGAGFTPSRIARQFQISQSEVKKALASDETKR